MLLLAAIGGAPVRAQSVWPVLVEAGAAGTWAYDCRAPVSGSNHREVISERAGKVRRVLDRGASLPPLNGWVDVAERLTPDTLRLRLRNDDANWAEADGEVFDIVVKVKDGWRNTVGSTRLSDGAVFVRDGRDPRSGVSVPAVAKCR